MDNLAFIKALHPKVILKNKSFRSDRHKTLSFQIQKYGPNNFIIYMESTVIKCLKVYDDVY